jgi:hypothetical protein
VKKFLAGYFAYLQVLIFAGFCYLLVWLMINYLSPTVVADLLWPDSYLIFQAILFLGNFCGFTFLFQNKRLGFWAALTIFTWLFFKLSHFILTFPLVVGIILSSALLLFCLYFYPKIRHRWQKS